MTRALESFRWRAGADWSPIEGRAAVVAIDPGLSGAIVFLEWDPATGRPLALLAHAFTDRAALVRWLTRNRAHLQRIAVVLVEEQHAAPPPKGAHPGARELLIASSLRLANDAGIVAAAASLASGAPIGWIPPSSWQVVLGPDRKKQTKPRAAELADAFLGAGGMSLAAWKTSGAREGVADTIGIAVWYAIRQQVEEGKISWFESALAPRCSWLSLRRRRAPHEKTTRTRSRARSGKRST